MQAENMENMLQIIYEEGNVFSMFVMPQRHSTMRFGE